MTNEFAWPPKEWVEKRKKLFEDPNIKLDYEKHMKYLKQCEEACTYVRRFD